MHIITGPRACGKTTRLMDLSRRTGARMVVTDYRTALRIQAEAKARGLEIPQPITFADLISGVGLRGQPRTWLLIDDADALLSMLAHGDKIEVVTICPRENITIERIDRGENPHLSEADAAAITEEYRKRYAL